VLSCAKVAQQIEMLFGCGLRLAQVIVYGMGPWGADLSIGMGNFERKGWPILKYGDALLQGVPKWLNRSRCHLGYRLWWPKEACIRQGPDLPYEGAIIRGNDMPGNARLHSAISCAKMAEPIYLPFVFVDLGGPKEAQVQLYSPGGANVPSWEGTLAAPGDYAMRRQCCLVSNYFDHLLFIIMLLLTPVMINTISMHVVVVSISITKLGCNYWQHWA